MASKTVRFDKALLTPLCRFNWVWVYATKDTDSGAKYMVDCIFNPAEMETPAFKALVAAAEKVGREAFPGGEYERLVAAGKFGSPFNKNVKKIDAKTGEMAE